ncbi:hypothetical protein [Streptomyces ipomoeae]|nr:hypothetical protein [Streptomyces ipomoeae]
MRDRYNTARLDREESCTFLVTTIEFRPTLERRRDDAAAKGQV